MNPRKIALSYLGWCPGMRSVENYLPDREISSTNVAITGISVLSLTILISFMLQILTASPPDAPLIITFDGKTYDDSQFPNDFDYSTIRDAVVKFYTPLDNSEFAKSGTEAETLSFESIDDSLLFLEDLGTPNIVKGFVPWISRGSFDEAYARFYGHNVNDSGLPEGAEPYIDLLFGDRDRGCFYAVYRDTFPGEIFGALGAPRGVTVIKYFSRPGSHTPIWYLAIEVDAPPYQAMFVRNPLPSR